jgi:DNA-directed RNA polymerase subunit beta'
MLRTTVGQLLVNEALPEEFRDYSRTLDAKATASLMNSIAQKYPERYRDISKTFSDIGRESAYTSGGFSVGLEDLRESKKAKDFKANLRLKIEQISNNNDDENSKNGKVISLLRDSQSPMEKEIYDEALKDNNQFARQIQSGSRGKPVNLKSLRGADLLYNDHHDNPIPIPVLRSYSSGLNPAEYFAGSFGARKGVTDNKFATMDAGFFSKQLNQIGHRMIITSDDAEDPTTLERRGLPVDVDDSDNEGSLLAMPVAGYGRNTVLTPRVLKDIQAKGNKRILIRSPLASGSASGGLYAKDLGIRERGGLSPQGDAVGIAAMQALSEPISQGQLNSKHAGGVAGTAVGVSGFKYLNQLVQSPKDSPYWARHAQNDGRVTGISQASAGGTNVAINGVNHYVGPGVKLKVKIGDMLEAGDLMSEGIANPAQFTKFKGIGEGRNQFVRAFGDASKEAGMYGHRRNIEVMSKGLINHVKLDEEYGDYSPDDVVPYDAIEHNWQPRSDATTVTPQQAVGSYLEKPVMHYTIGTPIRPSMIKNFKEFGINDVTVHKNPPPFQPHFVRGLENLQHDPDWMTRMLGSNLKKSTLNAVHRGAVSDENSTSYVPSLAKGVDFGRKGQVMGFNTKQVSNNVLDYKESEGVL